jgi:hypothetical protein
MVEALGNVLEIIEWWRHWEMLIEWWRHWEMY